MHSPREDVEQYHSLDQEEVAQYPSLDYLKRDTTLCEEHLTQGSGSVSVSSTCVCVRAKLDLRASFTVMERETTPSALTLTAEKIWLINLMIDTKLLP